MILTNLTKGSSETYALDRDRLPRLARAFDRALCSDTALPELHRAVQLAIALEDELGSPTAAANLWALIRSAPVVLEALRRHVTKPIAIDRARSFFAREGRVMPLRAPGVPGPWKTQRPRKRAGGWRRA
jgi:hypothetical protein